MLLRARDIHKSFDDQPILRGVSLAAAEGEIVALLGPSGCGKTTLLRIIAGLETPDRGQLLLEEVDLTSIPVHQRKFGMVFQDYALFPHKNVRQNVEFGLRMSGWDQTSMNYRVNQVLTLVGLKDFGDRAVHELSGGEQQRVALARALAPFPRLLLLDEPLGSLDKALRERLMGELRSILRSTGDHERLPQPHTTSGPEPGDTLKPMGQEARAGTAMTSIYVTHDQEEAFAIADRVLVMNRGQIEQAGSPVELYRQPETPFVARFLGMENLMQVEIISRDPPLVRGALGDLRLSEVATGESRVATLLIRPEAASLPVGDDEGHNILDGRLIDVSFRGRHHTASVQFSITAQLVTLKFNFDSAVRLPTVPSSIGIKLDPAGLRLL